MPKYKLLSAIDAAALTDMVNEHINLGRIAGIHVGANWSVLVVLWLIAWSLAAEQLPVTYPGHSTSAYWARSVGWAIPALRAVASSVITAPPETSDPVPAVVGMAISGRVGSA